MKNALTLYKIISILPACLFSNHLALSDEAVRYNIDTAHSSVEFSIRHFVAKTNGNFSEFKGFIDVDIDHPEENYAEASISIPSIDTNSDKRDAHLQEDDYFNSSEYPLITFKSTKWESTERENTYLVYGDLTMNNITHNISMDVELLEWDLVCTEGIYRDGGKTIIDRTDWNINGGIGAVGETVGDNHQY